VGFFFLCGYTQPYKEEKDKLRCLGQWKLAAKVVRRYSMSFRNLYETSLPSPTIHNYVHSFTLYTTYTVYIIYIIYLQNVLYCWILRFWKVSKIYRSIQTYVITTLNLLENFKDIAKLFGQIITTKVLRKLSFYWYIFVI